KFRSAEIILLAIRLTISVNRVPTQTQESVIGATAATDPAHRMNDPQMQSRRRAAHLFSLDLPLTATNMPDSSRPDPLAPHAPRLPPRSSVFERRRSVQGPDMSTYMPKPGEIKANWHVVDATDQVLGRLAARISLILQGKHKPTYTPHVDTGDFVVVINAEKVKVTGRKADVIEYDTYSRYPGGRHVYSYKRMHELHPEKVVELAVR